MILIKTVTFRKLLNAWCTSIVCHKHNRPHYLLAFLNINRNEHIIRIRTLGAFYKQREHIEHQPVLTVRIHLCKIITNDNNIIIKCGKRKLRYTLKFCSYTFVYNGYTY